MADYIYLLENRLSQAQQQALNKVREVARARKMTVFLVGGAVRDLTSGSPVRDLDVAIQGNALKLKKDIEKTGGVVIGEAEPIQALFLRFPGGVRMEISSTLTFTYPKPGKSVVKPATILEDLRSRDFTANAMALSLNDGSYGLLMDPLNGVADIENRQLRLVSNYGFIEDPARMIRAVRLAARLGWQMEEKTQARYATGKQEGYISAMGSFHRGYETEEIVYEEDPLRVLKRLEAEGWMKHLFPKWTVTKASAAELEKVRTAQTQLQMQGIHPDPSAINFPLLTAKMTPPNVKALKKSFARPGFVAEIQAVEAKGKAFAAQIAGKNAAVPSQAWKMLMTAEPEAVLWAAYASKNGIVQARLKSFYSEWPQARQKIPYALLQEMRITPELPIYEELLNKLFFQFMDEKLGTPEELRAYLEPYSPPAPPPPVSLRRPRAAKKDAKPTKSRAKKTTAAAGEGAAVAVGAAVVPIPAAASATAKGAPVKEAKPAPAAKATAKPAKVVAPVNKAAAPAKAAAKKPAAKVPTKKAAKAKKPAPAKKVPAKKPIAKAAPRKALPKKKTAAKRPAPTKKPTKRAAKPPAKKVAAKKPVAKAAPRKALPKKKTAAKKPAPAKKPVKKAAKPPAKKVAAKKSTAKRVPPKKTAAKAPTKKNKAKTAKNAKKRR